MVYQWIAALRKNLFKDSLEEHLKKNHENAKSSICNFVILNLVKKDILFFHVTTATDICMKEVTDRCLCRAL